MELFKYCRKPHMEAMLASGAARIGTLFDWRRSSAYGELIADESEGHTTLTGNLIFYDTTHLQSMLVDSHVGSEADRSTSGVPFRNEALRTHNHFAFSASATYSKEDHTRWFELEGYNACYRIHSAKLFFRALSVSEPFVSLARFVCHAPVLYFDPALPNNVFTGTFHPGLIKRSAFGSQAEHRALWSSTTSVGIEPIVVSHSNAKRYVSPHALL